MMPAKAMVLTVVLILSGCTLPSYRGNVRPISPGVGAPGFAETVDSLTPTFRWRADSEAPCKDEPPSPCVYDFAIWDQGKAVAEGMGTVVEFGPTLYRREGLSRPEHTVELALGPDSTYFWSVRIRTGDKVSAWGTYDFHSFAVVTTVRGKNWRYPFKTPRAAVKEAPREKAAE
jgi:hypothetical protein